MIYIPGFLIGWATFPGVIIHEFAHKKACEWRNIPVTEVNYFDLSGGGHVQHQQPRDYHDTLLISTAPLLFNSVVAVVLWALGGLALATLLPLPLSTYQQGLAGLAFSWLALSTGWHAIPSFVDTGHVWGVVKGHWRRSMLAALLLPVVVLLYIANLLKFFWFDAIYSISLGLIGLFLLYAALGVDPFGIFPLGVI